MIYRIKQVIWAISCSFVNIDYNYIAQYLNEDEIILFNKLKHSEKHHCIRVCNDCLRINKEKNLNANEVLLGKLALLHDIGKIEYKLNIIKKSILVILNKLTDGKLKSFSKFKSVDIYYNHGLKGKNILLQQTIVKNNYSDDFLDAIENHHKCINNKNNNVLLEILIEADNIN